MFCPRIDHFRRIESNGNIGMCGHMVNAPTFVDLPALEDSTWLKDLRSSSTENWPAECERCRQEERSSNKSIRLHTMDRHPVLTKIRTDYLIVGGTLDNICNSACQFCNSQLSTKIGSLESGKDYVLVDNTSVFDALPQDRIIELDINGGEPSNSPNYTRLLKNLPTNVKFLRINTNASRIVDNIDTILTRGIVVHITISLDGTGHIYEYARWPLKWERFVQTVLQYRQLREKYKNLKLNFWSTISAYTVADVDNMDAFAKHMQIDISHGILFTPSVLNVSNSNPLTRNSTYNRQVTATGQDNTQQLRVFLERQDRLRGTNFEDIYNWS
jgi:sulfatase maturation enzyme AslB (radical SAM superfamily)